ncbi:MAG: hypothetical protein O7B25_05760 [Gammaproteobacteria bacterium]|nr:hypothetical protein [Gammaproteobacteria bacterium]
MKRYLFSWECGAGLGHLAPYLKLIEVLLERGHEVMFACRNLVRAEGLYGHLPVKLIQSPRHQLQPEDQIAPKSYLDVLINQGFADPLDLKARVKAWLQLLDMWQPSTIVADHSPTLLLAHRLDPRAVCIVAGSGYCIPPLRHPFPPFVSQSAGFDETALQRERELLDLAINPVLEDLGGPAMANCQQLFSPQPHWLYGLSSLDHYPGRRSEAYLGSPPSMGGELASWPDAPGPKVFVYLKPHPVISVLLATLRDLRWPTLIYGLDWPETLRQEAQVPTIRLASNPVDLHSVGNGCQLAINNAGVNGVTQLLRAGVPQLLLPMHAEQQMFARSAQATGACLIQSLDSNGSDSWRDALKAAVDPAGAQKKAAAQFAQNQANTNPTIRVEDLLCQLESV